MSWPNLKQQKRSDQQEPAFWLRKDLSTTSPFLQHSLYTCKPTQGRSGWLALKSVNCDRSFKGKPPDHTRSLVNWFYGGYLALKINKNNTQYLQTITTSNDIIGIHNNLRLPWLKRTRLGSVVNSANGINKSETWELKLGCSNQKLLKRKAASVVG